MHYLLRLLAYSGHAGYEGEYQLPPLLLPIADVIEPKSQGQLRVTMMEEGAGYPRQQ